MNSLLNKIEAKARLTSFRIIPPNWISKPQEIRRQGERFRDDLQWIKDASPDPALTVGYMDHFGAQLVFYVFHADKCAGVVTFDLREGRIVAKDAGLRIQGPLATPHSVLAPAIRSKGIATFLYLRALKAGMTLVSECHTDTAALLWSKLSSQPMVNLYHFEAGKLVSSQTRNSIKILTTKRMKTNG